MCGDGACSVEKSSSRFGRASKNKDAKEFVNQHKKSAKNSKKVRSTNAGPEELGDFTTTLRVIPISALAIVIGAVCAVLALVLLKLIGLFTNLFYFGRWNTAMVSPVGNHLG